MKATKMTEIENVEKKISDLKAGIEKVVDVRRNIERALKNAKDMQVNIIASNRPHQDQRDNLLVIRNYLIDLDACNESIANSHQLMNQLNQRSQALVKEVRHDH